MSYADKILEADGQKAVARATQEGLSHYGAILNGLVNATPWDDLPLLLATMQLTAQAMRPMIGERGRGIVDKLLENTQAVAVNAGALRKERGEG